MYEKIPDSAKEPFRVSESGWDDERATGAGDLAPPTRQAQEPRDDEQDDKQAKGSGGLPMSGYLSKSKSK